MTLLITGSSGHLGEALVRTLRERGDDVVGLDITPGPFTTRLGSIADRNVVARAMQGVTAVIHAATLHKPHVETHGRQEFIDTNVTGTLNLLEEAAAADVKAFVFTSTTSAFGAALTPAANEPAAWITEDVHPVPRNIYGVSKCAAEDLCELFHRLHRLPCIVLRTSRFFPEPDDNPKVRDAYDDANIKANELLYRRVDIADVVDAHLLALRRAASIGFAHYIISATTPFERDDLPELRRDAAAVVARRVPEYVEAYARRGWKMFQSIDRVYVNDRARRELDWKPKYDFRHVVASLNRGIDFRSPLAKAIGSKGYHPNAAAGRSYPFT